MECKFHVVSEEAISIPGDGLLGNDFLSKNCNIEGPNKVLKFPKTDTNNFEFNIPLEFEEIKVLASTNKIIKCNEGLEEDNPIDTRIPVNDEVNSSRTKSNVVKQESGSNEYLYAKNENLNKKSSRKKNTVPVRESKCNKSVLQSNKSEVNVNSDENLNQKSEINKITKVIKLNKSENLPPRAKKIIKIPIDLPDEMICEASEIESGVFNANTITSSCNGMTYIGIINVNLHEVKINSIKLNFYTLKDYELKKLKNSGEKQENIFKIQSVKQTNAKNEKTTYEIDKDRLNKLLQEITIDETLNQVERESLLQICQQYNDIFHLKGDKLTHTEAMKHTIPVFENQAPINQKMYRLPECQREIINTQVKEMLENDIVQQSKSPWNSPLLVVPKKSGPDGEKKWRVVVDFRKLNDKTISDVFPLPRIEEILDQLGHSRYFTTLDLASGYHQVLVHPQDREKTAFSTAYGHYEFKRMPFGLKGAPATFQRLMNYVLTGLQGIECFVFLDDIVIYAKNLEDHNKKLTKVFDRLRENNLKLQPSKCQFLKKEVVYLGHKCTSEGAIPDPGKVVCVQNFPAPRTVKQVQSFLGLANFYRKYIPQFSKIVLPITKLLRKDVKFVWSEECQKAFEKIKEALITPPLLIYPDFTQPFILTTDASNEAIGAVLSQGKKGEEKPIAYASRTLNKAERNYSTIEKELLAIVWAVRNFRCYLLGRKFTVYTDHKPLKGIFNVKDPTSRLVRFHYKLSEYDYNIEYKPGKSNSNADALSRIPLTEDEKNKNGSSSYQGDKSINAGKKKCQVVTRAQIHKANDQKDDNENIKQIKTKNKTRSKKKQNKNKEQKEANGKIVKNNTEKKENEELNSTNVEEQQSTISEDPDIEQLEETQIIKAKNPVEFITDPEEIQTILKDYHDSIYGGHQGVFKTYMKIKRKFKWKNMLRDIKSYIKKCPKCQKLKTSFEHRMPMVITDTPNKPFEKVFLDLVGPLETTHIGNKYILTFQDGLTKFVDWYPLPNAEAETVAKTFVDELITRYRIPKQLVTDQGTNFLSELFRKVCKLLKIKKIHTTAYHPQSNGALERAHRPLMEYLRTVVAENPQTWDQYLRTAAFVYNNSVHDSTKLTPMDCLFGFTSDIPSNLKRETQPLYNHENYYYVLKHKLQKLYALAKENIQKSKQRSKEYYDRKLRPISFKIGDKVLLKNEAKKNKFSTIWQGPYEVIDVPNEVNTTILIRKKPVKVHNNRLKPFYE